MKASQGWQVAEAHVLSEAELISVGCPIDGRRHLIDDQMHAEGLAASAEHRIDAPRFQAVCGKVVLPDSLVADPRPDCLACARCAASRLREARERVVTRRVPTQSCPLPVVDSLIRVVSMSGAVLARFHGGRDHEATRCPSHRNYELAPGRHARRTAGPGEI
ncbi:hypothetical protein [Pseudonocardia sp. HH130630-07]|uniref:hypothetical protein n=1 Tax=Pseudonocardia sp. HH130630-07 TaxID=1690815 RepID=UPI0012EAC210|nr:hypothetical protein [Pseudonocardia sp. HH130630-07]